MSNSTLSHRQRVLLALNHQPTDRVPIAMVCSGINAPAHAELEAYLRRHRGIGIGEYLEPLIDIANVGAAYVGPPLADGMDIWGVHRSAVSYGQGSYEEIDHYPLAAARTVDDVLQALQFDAHGMDASALKSRYGDVLCFEGGISVQKTLPFGTPDEVREEVAQRIAVLGRGGGYILGPSHAIQAGTPPENIVAMFDTAGGLA